MLSSTFVLKILRNFFVDRNHPFFAHYFVTERCNLRCSYCEVYKNPTEELDTEGAGQVIEKLAKMGIAVLSFTGGEPLLRKDIFGLIDLAKRKGLCVKISSNGTLARSYYKSLLETGVDSINISMDGMNSGSTLPYSKMDAKILATIDYLYANRGQKQFFISALYFNGNGTYIKNMVRFVARNYPRLEVFIQPVMAGDGGWFRSKQCGLVDMDLLRELQEYDNVTNPHYFNEHCEKYFKSGGNYDWGCKAGRQFFDIKPNGDFWLCQDKPTNLNILDPDFARLWRSCDFTKLKKGCRGCTYSCYVLAQRSFEWRNFHTWYHYSKRL